MKFIATVPFSDIDWAATGAMISAFFAIIIAWRQNNLSRKIAKKQFSQTEQELKISLYDKRYTVYQCFMRCFELGNLLTKEPFQSPYNKDLIPQIFTLPTAFFDSADNLKRQYDLSNLYSAFIPQNVKEEISRQILFENLNFCKWMYDTIQLAEFCFDDDISMPVIDFVVNFMDFTQLNILQTNYQSHITYNQPFDLDCCTEYINKMRPLYEKAKLIQPKMKALLKVSYGEAKDKIELGLAQKIMHKIFK